MHTRFFRDSFSYFGLGFIDGWLLAQSDQQLRQENNPIRHYLSYQILATFLGITPPAIALQTAEERNRDCAIISLVGFVTGLAIYPVVNPIKYSPTATPCSL